MKITEKMELVFWSWVPGFELVVPRVMHEASKECQGVLRCLLAIRKLSQGLFLSCLVFVRVLQSSTHGEYAIDTFYLP